MYNDLSDRKKAILKAIIDAHIENGEPVGSKALIARGGGFDLSSATIRNEMAELEAMGYLAHPHTSAGRVPTDLGYRFYVDDLMQDYALTTREIAELNRVMRAKTAELDRIINDACKVVSSLTNYTSIGMSPKSSNQSVMRFSITPIDQRSFLLVVIPTKNQAKTKFVHSEIDIPEEALETLESLLNIYVAGKNIQDITLSMIMRMEEQMGEYSGIITPIIKYICDMLGGSEEPTFKVGGVDRLLEYPEYHESENLRGMLGIIENKAVLRELMEADTDDDVSVFIGSETSSAELRNSSVVFKKIVVGGEVVGAIGVIGPSRMDYSKVISTIRYLSDSIEGRISDDDNGNND